MSLILCLRAELLTLGAEGGGGGQASQIGAGGFGQGLAAELDTLRREDVRHLLAPSHNQAGGRPLTPGSSVSSSSMTVADLTAEGEEEQVHHTGWAPCPRGRKCSRKYRRLVRGLASAIRDFLQKEDIAFLT